METIQPWSIQESGKLSDLSAKVNATVMPDGIKSAIKAVLALHQDQGDLPVVSRVDKRPKDPRKPPDADNPNVDVTITHTGKWVLRSIGHPEKNGSCQIMLDADFGGAEAIES